MVFERPLHLHGHESLGGRDDELGGASGRDGMRDDKKQSGTSVHCIDRAGCELPRDRKKLCKSLATLGKKSSGEPSRAEEVFLKRYAEGACTYEADSCWTAPSRMTGRDA